MHPRFALTLLVLLGVFAAGYALGWLTSLMRTGSISVKAGLSPTRAVSSRTQVYQVNCQCGHVLKFHGADETGASGLPPLPEGDSYPCPKCGAALNLRRIRETIASVKLSRT